MYKIFFKTIRFGGISMNSDFARIITLQRKERHISQKQAATDLGISQALLSHYEKGIRECGLNFLVKIADYYNVSCDYLLGRTPEPEGKTITIEDIPDDDGNNSMKMPSGLRGGKGHSRNHQLQQKDYQQFYQSSLQPCTEGKQHNPHKRGILLPHAVGIQALPYRLQR